MPPIPNPRIGFVYDCNIQSLTALQLLKATFENPSGSNKKIIIEGYAIPNVTNVGAMATLHHQPTGGTPSTVFAPLPYMVGTDISNPGHTGIFKANVVTALSGGFTGGTSILTIPVKPMDRNYIQGAPITLLPGAMLGFLLSPGVIMAGVSVVVYAREEVA
jgi:hypothetical protein